MKIENENENLMKTVKKLSLDPHQDIQTEFGSKMFKSKPNPD